MSTALCESTNEIKVIVRVEGGHLIFFFPEIVANFGSILCWTKDEEHGEADMGYYRSLRNPEEDGMVEHLMAFYEKRYQVAGHFTLKRVQRDSDKMRRARWKKR